MFNFFAMSGLEMVLCKGYKRHLFWGSDFCAWFQKDIADDPTRFFCGLRPKKKSAQSSMKERMLV